MRNAAFIERVINKVQHMDPKNSIFCIVLTEYLFNAGVMAYDKSRDLFWVNHPSQGYQVAVWLVGFGEVVND
jgi:hypothetical protein